MRTIAATGLFLYAFANLFAATVDVVQVHRLRFGVVLALFATGGWFLAGGIMVLRRAPHALAVVLVALILAGGLAVFNERVLGLGHPSHHLVRGLLTILLAGAAAKATRDARPESDAITPDVGPGGSR